MPRISYRPDSYNDGRFAIIRLTDGVPEEVEVNLDREYVARRVGELNRDIILTTLFPEQDEERLREINVAARKVAEAILLNTPSSADQSTAIRSIREAVLWSQQAITLEGYA